MTRADRPSLDAALVRRLVAAQFPQWADLPVEPVTPGGWDNRTFRLGANLVVRMPSARTYAAAILREQAWLPQLAPKLPLPISAPVALGAPGEGYHWPWSISPWLDGRTAEDEPPADRLLFAEDLGAFLRALHGVDASEGPPPGPDNFHRGGDLAVYGTECEAALAALGGVIDVRIAERIWRDALEVRFVDPPVWVHGDLAPSNLLVRDGRLCAVIDFGQLAVGDPSCDFSIAWTFFDAAGRARLRESAGVDPGAWARAKGWTLWKASIVTAGHNQTAPRQAQIWRSALQELLGAPND